MQDQPETTDEKGIAHHPAWPLSWANDNGWMDRSEALLSAQEDVDTAVVFVHGYGGSSAATWENFRQALRSAPKAARTDAFFWGYPSRRHKVEMCAAALRDFLGDLLRKPEPTIVGPSLPPGAEARKTGFRYRRVVLCAHSMGAVLVRRAMIDLEVAGGLRKPVPQVRLLLFAPAHKGSNLPLLLATGLGLDWLPGAGLVAAALRFWSPAIDDLGKGSETLMTLEQDSRALRTILEKQAKRVQEPDDDSASTKPGIFEFSGDEGYKRILASLTREEKEPDEEFSTERLRARVLHAQNDRVVEMTRFDADPPFTRVMRQGHSSICKPRNAYPDPVDALRKLL